MVNELVWKVWLREKERLEEIRDLMEEARCALIELSEASNPDGLKNAMFERRELGGSDVSRTLLEDMLFNLSENITAGITEHEEYLKNYED